MSESIKYEIIQYTGLSETKKKKKKSMIIFDFAIRADAAETKRLTLITPELFYEFMEKKKVHEENNPRI